MEAAFEKGDVDMSVEDHKFLVRRFYKEVVSAGDVDLLDEIASDDITDHAAIGMGLGPGRQGFKGHIEAVRRAVPNFHAEVTELIGEDDLVVAYWTATGAAAVKFLSVEAGHSFMCTAISRLRFADGRIVEYQVMVGPVT
jgi:ketosteroid isomerase-like protein